MTKLEQVQSESEGKQSTGWGHAVPRHHWALSPRAVGKASL